jgi:hypothetical protein
MSRDVKYIGMDVHKVGSPRPVQSRCNLYPPRSTMRPGNAGVIVELGL